MAVSVVKTLNPKSVCDAVTLIGGMGRFVGIHREGAILKVKSHPVKVPQKGHSWH